MPVNTRLAEKPEWNQRTVLQKNEYEKTHDAITRTAKTACSKMRQFTIDRATYTSPINSTIKFQDEVRRQKEEGRFDWSKLVYRDPTLDDPVDRSLLRNRYRIQGSRTFQTDQHSGIWEYNKAEGRYVILAFTSYSIIMKNGEAPFVLILLLLLLNFGRLGTCGLIQVPSIITPRAMLSRSIIQTRTTTPAHICPI